ncbi:hypothetical protein ACFL08_04190 [Patescibacteria group bacterium]
MKIQLIDDVDYDGTEKIPFKNWLSEASQRLKIKSLAQKIDRYGICENIFCKNIGYCEFFDSDCTRCSLSRHQLEIVDGENREVVSICNKNRGSLTIFILRGRFSKEGAEAINAAKDEAIKKDGIRWGYYTDPDQK